jgi:FkbM family methyltransferase
MMVEWMKSAIVRSPLEGPAKAARRTLGLYKLWKHPELHEIWLEEARIARLIGKMVHESCNCVDVGGHLGAILSLFVKHAPRGRHWAFEPNPQQARWLERKFPEVEVRRLALGDSRQERPFYILEDRSGFSGLRRMDEPGERIREVGVQVDRLDAVIGPDHRVDFLKVVVEGGELSVLRGAEEILRRDRPFLLFECTPPHWSGSATRPPRCSSS